MIFTEEMLNGKVDDNIHGQLTRFGKGTYKNRALIKINIIKDKLKVNTSYDLMKDLTIIVAKNFDKIKISGKIINGKNKEEIEKEVSGQELLEICKNNDFTILNLDFEDYSIKVGKSLPKPGSSLKDNFCKCVLPISILNELTNKKDFKKAVITHTFIVEEIIIQEEYKNDFAKARKYAKRKGKLIKNSIIDKKEEIQEKDFEA
ncbi:MAG: hypothetical protein ABIH25_00660 [Candidatus Woesearchaeota archaeon]